MKIKDKSKKIKGMMFIAINEQSQPSFIPFAFYLLSFLFLFQIIIMIRKNILTILVSVAIFWLSMTNSNTFENVKLVEIPNSDKMVHVGMYFVLMSSILYENRKKVNNYRSVLTAALFPLSYGILIEILQSLTVSRSASFYDALADAAGIIISVVLWKLIKPAKAITK